MSAPAAAAAQALLHLGALASQADVVAAAAVAVAAAAVHQAPLRLGALAPQAGVVPAAAVAVAAAVASGSTFVVSWLCLCGPWALPL